MKSSSFLEYINTKKRVRRLASLSLINLNVHFDEIDIEFYINPSINVKTILTEIMEVYQR